MAGSRGQNPLQGKTTNVTSVKWLLFRRAPISRAEIAGILGLTPASVTNIVSDLIAQKVVRELPESRDESKTVGRKPIDIDLIPDAFHVIGMVLGRFETQVCLTDLRGKLIAKEKAPRAPERYADLLDFLTMLGKHMLDLSGKTPVLGMGVAIPGIVSSRDGIFIHGTADPQDWIGKPMAADLAEKMGIPVRIDNNGRARAKRIALFSPEVVEGSDSFLVCHVYEGISCHMQLMSRFLHGEGNAAGEIGSMIMIPDSQTEIPYNQTLNGLANIQAIQKQLRDLLNESDQPSVLRTLCPDKNEITVQQILQAQQLRDPLVCQVMERAMRYIGIALTNIVDFVNPRYIVLTGPLFRNTENVEIIRNIIMKYAYSADISNLKLEYHDAGEFAGALCGASLAVHHFFLNESVLPGI